MTELLLDLDGTEARTTIGTVIVAGWTGRDKEALEHHMAELGELGVARPSSAPIFYRVSAARLTTASEIESTDSSSGEVEAVLLQADGRLWVGVGSDHTDREVETYSVAVSKQMCEKPIASQFWLYDDIVGHWDDLAVRSWIVEAGAEVLYQEGTLKAMLPPEDLLQASPPLSDGVLMFCGTLAAKGGIRPAREFHYELRDPVLGRQLSSYYSVRSLPLIS